MRYLNRMIVAFLATSFSQLLFVSAITMDDLLDSDGFLDTLQAAPNAADSFTDIDVPPPGTFLTSLAVDTALSDFTTTGRLALTLPAVSSFTPAQTSPFPGDRLPTTLGPGGNVELSLKAAIPSPAETRLSLATASQTSVPKTITAAPSHNTNGATARTTSAQTTSTTAPTATSAAPRSPVVASSAPPSTITGIASGFKTIGSPTPLAPSDAAPPAPSDESEASPSMEPINPLNAARAGAVSDRRLALAVGAVVLAGFSFGFGF